MLITSPNKNLEILYHFITPYCAPENSQLKIYFYIIILTLFGKLCVYSRQQWRSDLGLIAALLIVRPWLLTEGNSNVNCDSISAHFFWFWLFNYGEIFYIVVVWKWDFFVWFLALAHFLFGWNHNFLSRSLDIVKY